MLKKGLLAEAIKYVSDKNLPPSLIEKCLCEDIDSTKTVIGSLATDWSKELEALSAKKMKTNYYVLSNGSDMIENQFLLVLQL